MRYVRMFLRGMRQDKHSVRLWVMVFLIAILCDETFDYKWQWVAWVAMIAANLDALSYIFPYQKED